jgi:hypothetical protein
VRRGSTSAAPHLWVAPQLVEARPAEVNMRRRTPSQAKPFVLIGRFERAWRDLEGRLGFSRALVLLGDRTKEFSNIQGVDRIPFSRVTIPDTSARRQLAFIVDFKRSHS